MDTWMTRADFEALYGFSLHKAPIKDLLRSFYKSERQQLSKNDGAALKFMEMTGVYAVCFNHARDAINSFSKRLQTAENFLKQVRKSKYLLQVIQNAYGFFYFYGALFSEFLILT